MKIQPIASGSTGNAYLISSGGSVLLLDAGIPIKKIQEACKHQLSSIDGCLITHRHGDHVKAVKDLVKKGVDIYASGDVMNNLDLTESHRAHELKELETVDIGAFKVTPFDVKHDVPCFGYVCTSGSETVAYITDAQYSPYRVDGVTHWIVECNFSEEQTRDNVEAGIIHMSYKDRVWNTHMSIDALEELLKSNDLSKLKQIYLIHLSDKNAREDEFKDRIQKLTGAEVYVC